MMKFYDTDPEFMERMEHFTFEEVVQESGQELPEETRHMVKEIVYQAVDYLGIGRVLPFLAVTNDILTARSVKLPLPSQGTTTMENRLEKGAQAQGNMNLGNDKDCILL